MQLPYEQTLGQNLYGGIQERSFIDKTLARSDVEEIKDIMQKEDLTRKDLLKMLYLLSGSEIKLVNFGEFERYLLGKYYAWIRDFVASAESLYDIKSKYGAWKKKVMEEKDVEKRKAKLNTLESIDKMLENSRTKLLHDIKFLCDVYLYLSRSTLSLEATAFDTITKQRYEYYYPQGQGQYAQPYPMQRQKQAGGLFGFLGGH